MACQKRTTVPKAIVEVLMTEAVEIVFGLAGSHILPILNELASTPEIGHVVVKHENSAAVMAGMYGYLTGRPGVALVTAGPGAAHAVSGVALAYASSNPMVLISGGVQVGSTTGAYHGVDRGDFLQEMFSPITKWTVRVHDPEDAAVSLADAFAIASSDRPGPVMVEFPWDILQGELVASRRLGSPTVHRQQPDEASVDATLGELAKSHHPILCAGRGVLVHHAEAELLSLVERLSAPVFWTTHADGVMPEGHPLAVGSFDPWTENPLAWELMRESDFMLVAGMRSGSLESTLLAERSPSSTVFVSLDEPGAFSPVDFALVSGAADVRLFLSRVLEQLPAQQRSADPSVLRRIDRRRRALSIGRNELLARHSEAQPMHFGPVLQEIASQVEQGAIVVAGVGNHSAWARTIFAAHSRDSFLATGPWGTMGAEVPGGICAKLIHPDRQVIVVTGDGSLLMALSDLATAAETKANVLIAVLNDSRYGMITAMQTVEFGRTFGDRLGPVDFAKQAQAVGLEGVRVERPRDLSQAVRRSLELTRESPVVLDAVCDSAFGWPDRETLIQEGLERLNSSG